MAENQPEKPHYLGSPVLYRRADPALPFRAQILFIFAIFTFGFGMMISMMFGSVAGMVASALLALVLASIPFAARWVKRGDVARDSENVTHGLMGPGIEMFPFTGVAGEDQWPKPPAPPEERPPAP